MTAKEEVPLHQRQFWLRRWHEERFTFAPPKRRLASYNLRTVCITVTAVAKGRTAQIARAYRATAVSSATATSLPPSQRRREVNIRQLRSRTQKVLNRANAASVK